MKKVFIASLVLLSVTLFFLGVYNFAFKKNTQVGAIDSSKTELTDQQKSEIEKKATQKIKLLSTEPVLSFGIDSRNETISFYSANDGTVLGMDVKGGDKKQISDKKLPNLKSALWSIYNLRAITSFESDGQRGFYSYDYSTKTGTALKSGIDQAVWDSIGSKIIYKYFDAKTKQRTLNVADADGSNWKSIAEIPFKYVSFASIPSTSIVAYWNSPRANEETQLYTSILAPGSEQKALFRGRFGADYLWSPDGSEALVSSLPTFDSKTISLGLLNLKGEYIDLKVPTVVSKCVWSADGKFIYYALPNGIPADAVMPDDYIDKKITTEDTFWKMEVATGKKERIIAPDQINGKYDASSLVVSPTEDAIFFINNLDRKLYRLEF
jgi:hypothetical protein